MSRRLVAGIGVLLAASLVAQEVDPFDPDMGKPVMVRVQIEYVQLSQAKYLELMAVKRSAADATLIRERLQEMVVLDEAEVLETGMVVARSGEKATAESICEYIYPSEFELSTWPGPGALGQLKPSIVPTFFRVPTVPPCFETRNVGNTIEIAPNVGANNRVVDLNFSPELVQYAGDTVHLEEWGLDGKIHKTRHPNFVKQGTTAAITCIDGQYNLVTVVTPPDEDGQLDPTQKLMVFVKCDVLVVKEGGK